MDTGTQDRLIAQIAWGRFWYDDGATSYVLRAPTVAEQAGSARKYATALRLAQATKLLDSDECIRLAVDRGDWSYGLDAKMESLKTDIRTLKRGMLDYVFQTDKLETIRRAVRAAETAYCDLATQRHTILTPSAEYFATMAAQRFTIGRVTLSSGDAQLWPSESDADSCEDIALLDRLCRFYFDDSRLRESVIRELARSTNWRSLWTSMLQCGCIFEGHPTGWTYNQQQLVYWAVTYDRVYESYSRPSDQIINDDDLLDSWFLRQGEESEKRTSKALMESITGKKDGKVKPGSFAETFVMTDKAGASKVYAMNDTAGRVQIRRRQEELARKGELREQQFSMVQQDLAMQARNTFAARTGGGT